MTVGIYAHTAASLPRLQGYCDALSVPPPICWDHTHLHRRLGDLVGLRVSVAQQAAVSINAGIAGIQRDVVVLHGLERPQVMALIQQYKADGYWPMLAITTPHSVEFSLAVLIEHLSDDRAREGAMRRQRTVQPK